MIHIQFDLMAWAIGEPSQPSVEHRKTQEFHSKSESRCSYACCDSCRVCVEMFLFFLGHFVGIFLQIHIWEIDY